MKAITILSGLVVREVDSAVDLRLDPDHTLFPIRSVRIASTRGEPVTGQAEVYVALVEVRARCYFNSTSDFLDGLLALAGRPALRVGGGAFTALVRISAGRTSVSIDDRSLPVVSVQVEIDPEELVRANVVLYDDFTESGSWTPDLAVLLLEACGWELAGVAP